MYLVDVATMLQTAGVGTIPTTIRYGRLPEDPNNLVVVRGYGGRPRLATHSGSKIRLPRVQVVCRNTDPSAAWAKADQVNQALDNIRNQDVNGTSYVQVAPTGEPYEIPSDTSGRTVIACNYEVWFVGSWT